MDGRLKRRAVLTVVHDFAWTGIPACADCMIEKFTKLVETGCGNNYRISSTSHVFRNPQESSTWILPKIQRKRFPLYVYLLAE